QFFLFVPPYFCFCYLPRRPPGPTLFPYTTLFRSVMTAHSGTLMVDPTRELVQTFLKSWVHETMLACIALFLIQVPFYLRRCLLLDRKSTRLNSSHVKISYAVFCLKKKKYCIIYVC